MIVKTEKFKIYQQKILLEGIFSYLNTNNPMACVNLAIIKLD